MPRAPHTPLFARELGLPTRFALYGLLCLALMLVDARYHALGFLRQGIAAVLHPVQTGLTRPFQYLGEALDFFTVHGELLRENKQLKGERFRLKSERQTLESLRMENTELRALLGLDKSTGYTTRAAEIIRVLPDPFNRKVLIDRGVQHGVEAGLPVADDQGLVGQVTRVFPLSSEVTLLTSRGQAAPVQVLRTGLRLIVTGIGQDRLLEVRFLDMHADLRPGDELVTSGLDGIYPQGIPVAKVLNVQPPRDTPFARALCEPISQVGAHRNLLVLRRQPGQS